MKRMIYLWAVAVILASSQAALGQSDVIKSVIASPANTPGAECVREKISALERDSGVRIDYNVILISLGFDLRDDEIAEAGNERNYVMVAPKQKKMPEILAACVTPPFLVVLAVKSSDISEDEFQVLYVNKLTAGAQKITKPVGVPLAFSSGSSGSPTATNNLTLARPNNRNLANIYLAGSIERASGSDTVGSVDIRLSYPFLRDFWSRTHTFTPLFDLRGSSNPSADNDTVIVGFDWDIVFNVKKNPVIKGLIWKNGVKTESNRDFRNTNLLYQTRLALPLNSPREFTSGHFLLTFDPFLGFETGKNVKSLLPAAEGFSIARPFFGANMLIAIPLGEPGGAEMNLEASYIRRLPLKRETTFDVDKDKKPFLVSFGTRPRDHVDVRLNFGFSKFFGAFIGYEWGQLPPLYRLVDHNLKIGFNYQVQFVKH